jgi:uncharacterized protein (DUF2236 family)
MNHLSTIQEQWSRWYGIAIIRTMSTLLPEETEARELLVGPQSVTWRFASDIRLYVIPLYPLLLQVAHPTVAAGVRDYSDFEERPWDRLLHTLDYVTLLVYGGGDAIPAGRQLRALHKNFKGVRDDGSPYYALEPGAYAWVHATLLHSYILGHQQFARAMSPSERETFYREYRDLGQLIGVRDGELPPTWAEFEDYFRETSNTVLEPTDQVHRVLHAVQHAAPPLPLPDPLWRAARAPATRLTWLGGVGLLEPGLRKRLKIPWSFADERSFQLLGRMSRSLTPALPERLQILGPHQLRVRRRAIRGGPLGAREQIAA